MLVDHSRENRTVRRPRDGISNLPKFYLKITGSKQSQN